MKPLPKTRRSLSNKRRRATTKTLDYSTLEARALLAVVISEFVASNTNSFEDGFGSSPDWIELHNSGTATINLNGYSLSDDPSDPTAWTFGSDLNLGAGDYLVVFASGDDLIDPAGFHHTNFKLSAGGDYLGIYDPAGALLSSYGSNGADFPEQRFDISYGNSGGTLVDENSPSFLLDPFNTSVDQTWRLNNFDALANGFSNADAAIGYENNPGSSTSYADEFSTPVTPGTTSVYLRTEFDIADVSAVNDLLLELKYDDGFAAYINGTLVLQRNAPANLSFSSFATADHSDNLSLQFAQFDLTNQVNLLRNGTNVLALHGLNRPNSSDFLLSPRLTTNAAAVPGNYLAFPTPGEANSGPVTLGPQVESVTPSGISVNPQQSLVLSAAVSDFTLPVDATSVRVHYRRNFGSEFVLTANDNGTGGDAVAGDGIFSATVPNVGNSGDLFRWYFSAEDSAGNTTRAPRFADALNSAEYFGTVVNDPSIDTDLPVLYWFVQDTSGTFTDAGARGSLFFNGQFYDNIDTNAHGQSTRGDDFAKKSFDFDSNSGEKFLISDEIGRASDFNLITNYADQSKIRNTLAYDIWAESGHIASLESIPVYVQRNGDFYGLYDLIEEGDEEFLDRVGLDTNGALYKVNNSLNSSTNEVDKESRTYEDHSDFQDVIFANVNLFGNALSRWIYDNVDVPTLINYLAVNSTIGNSDFGHKNMYWYKDVEGTGLWYVLPWDQDLSFGHQWGGANPPYFDNVLYSTSDLTVGLNNLFQRVYTDSTLNEMFNRRLKSISDLIYGAPGSNVADSFFNTRVSELQSLVDAEAIEDQVLWGTHPNFAAQYPFTPSQAADQFNNTYSNTRRNFIAARNGVPGSQTGIPPLIFSTSDFDVSPVSGLQSQEYIRIDNPTNLSADISQWKLTGGIDYEFLAGTVVPAGGSLYVAADIAAFKTRTSGPSGNQSLFISGGYDGQISNTGETINLLAATGETVDVLNTPAASLSNNQDFLRITEVNYNPSNSLPGTEFLEFFNRDTSVTLNLGGVSVSEGFATPFVFPAGTTLAPQQYLLIAEDVNAFASAYPNVPANRVVGQYVGGLSNGGEAIRVDDVGGEKILEFQYNDSFPWAQAADGAGASLELIDSNAALDSLGKSYAWTSSPRTGGSPNGQSIFTSPQVVINEVLAHTDLPDLDFIELANLSDSDIDISGWFLSDSSDNLEKYEIPLGTIIPAGGLIVFDENDFNSGVPINGNIDFGLSSTGDEVWLTERDNVFGGSGHRFIDEVTFAATFNGQSIGTFADGSALAPLRSSTPGQPNAATEVTLLISEVNYHPDDPTPAEIAIDPTLESSDLEFIEIHNPTTNAINLQNWRIRGEVDFDFSADVIAAGASAVITSFDPDSNAGKAQAFRSFYGISSAVVLIGGYDGQLSNSQGLVRLQAPDSPDANDPTDIPHVDVDQVLYDDQTPLESADGGGDSVNRITTRGAGLDSTNITAAAPTPGVFESAFLIGDTNQDGVVNFLDISHFINLLQTQEFLAEADINGDGDVDFLDISPFINLLSNSQ